MKVCTKCKIEKKLEYFSKDKTTKDGKRPICKSCDKENKEKYKKTKNGWLSDVYSGQRCSSKTRGMAMPNYTREALGDWAFAHSCFETLFKNWEDSNYDKDLKPSVDRLDDNKPYTLDNIQLITFRENVVKYYNKTIKTNMKEVYQFTKDGELVAKYNSLAEASKQTGVYASGISGCVNGTQKSAGGYCFSDDIEFRTYVNEHSVTVKQYTKDMKFIAEYSTIKEASKATGVYEDGISLCSRGKQKRCGGFIWKRNNTMTVHYSDLSIEFKK